MDSEPTTDPALLAARRAKAEQDLLN
jgi:hypothetical protein